MYLKLIQSLLSYKIIFIWTIKSRDVLLKHIRAETKTFFQELFGNIGRIETDAFTDMQIRLKETESALNETLEKRNQLETERIQLLDQIAELRVSLGPDKIF